MRNGMLAVAVVAAGWVMLGAAGEGDIVIADFEGATYGDWTVTGEAFGPGPAHGTLPHQMPVSGFKGKGLVNSFFNGDGATGTLTSPDFTIQRKRICFLIGGGMHPGETCMNLLVDGKVARTATGPNDKPGGSEQLHWQTWDVSDLIGKKAVLQIVDQNTGGWGHINVDQIIQCEEPPEKEMTMKLAAEKRYLNLPVKTGAPKRRMQVCATPKPSLGAPPVVREFDIELADGPPDFWVFLDLTPFQGQELTIHVDALDRDSKALEAITQDDAIKGAENRYREALRPQFHFSSRRGWNNDPNGLLYHDGEYHLYYQHNPYGWKWDNMHWGHAVSEDLVHWTELPIALYPKQYGDWCFSGSAVADVRNTGGFKTGGEDVIVAAFTSTGRGECIAFSNDRGRTFTDYDGNPVVKHAGRDPKVIWHEPTQRWVMAVYDEQEGKKGGIAFYTSADLKHWELQSRIEEYYECPEIFKLPVDGDARNTKWVVYSGNGGYAIGSFDGRVFTPESGKHHYNWGNCFYASQTFNGIPPEDGRRIQIGWGTIELPGMPFNQMMTFPCALTLRTTEDGIRMFAQPVKEIATLRGKAHTFGQGTAGGQGIAGRQGIAIPCPSGENPLAGITGDLFHIRAEFTPGSAVEFGFIIRGVPVTYHVEKQELACRDKTAPLKPAAGRIRLEILVDRASIEIFGNDGLVYMPMGVIPAEDNKTLEVFAKGGNATVNEIEIFELRSVWK